MEGSVSASPEASTSTAVAPPPPAISEPAASLLRPFTDAERVRMDAQCRESFAKCQAISSKKASLKVLIIMKCVWEVAALSLRLKRLGCATTVAHNGRKAFRHWEEDTKKASMPFDVVFIDREMDWIGGIEFVRMVKQYQRRHRTKDVAIIAVCRGGDNPLVVMSEGFDHFIKRPLRLHHLTIPCLLLPEHLQQRHRLLLFSRQPAYQKILEVFESVTALNDELHKQLKFSDPSGNEVELEELLFHLNSKCNALEDALKTRKLKDRFLEEHTWSDLIAENEELKKQNVILRVTAGRKGHKHLEGLMNAGRGDKRRSLQWTDEMQALADQLREENESLKSDVDYLATRDRLEALSTHIFGEKLFGTDDDAGGGGGGGRSGAGGSSANERMRARRGLQRRLAGGGRSSRSDGGGGGGGGGGGHARGFTAALQVLQAEEVTLMAANDPLASGGVEVSVGKDGPNVFGIRRYGDELWAKARGQSKVAAVEADLEGFLDGLAQSEAKNLMRSLAEFSTEYHRNLDKTFVVLLTALKNMCRKKVDADPALKQMWTNLARYTTKIESLELGYVSLVRDAATHMAAGVIDVTVGPAQHGTSHDSDRSDDDEDSELPAAAAVGGGGGGVGVRRRPKGSTKMDMVIAARVKELEDEYGLRVQSAEERERRGAERLAAAEAEREVLLRRCEEGGRTAASLLTLQHSTYRAAHQLARCAGGATPAELKRAAVGLHDVYDEMMRVGEASAAEVPRSPVSNLHRRARILLEPPPSLEQMSEHVTRFEAQTQTPSLEPASPLLAAAPPLVRKALSASPPPPPTAGVAKTASVRASPAAAGPPLAGELGAGGVFDSGDAASWSDGGGAEAEAATAPPATPPSPARNASVRPLDAEDVVPDAAAEEVTQTSGPFKNRVEMRTPRVEFRLPDLAKALGGRFANAVGEVLRPSPAQKRAGPQHQQQQQRRKEAGELSPRSVGAGAAVVSVLGGGVIGGGAAADSLWNAVLPLGQGTGSSGPGAAGGGADGDATERAAAQGWVPRPSPRVRKHSPTARHHRNEEGGAQGGKLLQTTAAAAAGAAAPPPAAAAAAATTAATTAAAPLQPSFASATTAAAPPQPSFASASASAAARGVHNGGLLAPLVAPTATATGRAHPTAATAATQPATPTVPVPSAAAAVASTVDAEPTPLHPPPPRGAPGAAATAPAAGVGGGQPPHHRLPFASVAAAAGFTAMTLPPPREQGTASANDPSMHAALKSAAWGNVGGDPSVPLLVPRPPAATFAGGARLAKLGVVLGRDLAGGVGGVGGVSGGGVHIPPHTLSLDNMRSAAEAAAAAAGAGAEDGARGQEASMRLADLLPVDGRFPSAATGGGVGGGRRRSRGGGHKKHSDKRKVPLDAFERVVRFPTAPVPQQQPGNSGGDGGGGALTLPALAATRPSMRVTPPTVPPQPPQHQRLQMGSGGSVGGGVESRGGSRRGEFSGRSLSPVPELPVVVPPHLPSVAVEVEGGSEAVFEVSGLLAGME